jgi:hypothetical protein
MIIWIDDVRPERLPGGLAHGEAMKNLMFFARCAIARLRANRFRITHPVRALEDRDRQMVKKHCVRGEFINEELIAKIRFLRELRRLEKETERAA